MSLTLDVVMPVLNLDSYTDRVLSDITKNTVLPNKIIMIDNGSKSKTQRTIEKYMDRLPIEYVRFDTNQGVNPAWNAGFQRSSADLLSILNNDLNLNTKFFEKILQTFETHPECGLAMPNTLKAVHENDDNNVEESFIMQGWAFTIRREIYARAGLIPPELKIFFGDNFLFEQTHLQGYKWLKMLDNHIIHLLSKTVNSLGIGPTQHKEEVDWKRIRQNMNTPKSRTHWTEIPSHIDMSPYAPFYQRHTRRGISETDEPLVVELGCRYGCSARIMLDELERSGKKFKLILVDPETTEELNEIIDGTNVELWLALAENIVDRFADQSIDVLHIDVDPHEYNQTKTIFKMYERKLKPNSVVLFHDCTPHFGVHRFVVKDLGRTGAWEVVNAKPQPECEISCPAAIRRV